MLIPNLNFGGAQRVFYDTSLFLAQYCDVIECVFNFEHGHAFPTGNKIVSLNVPAGKNLLDKFYQFVIRCLKFRKLKKELHADVCISHMEGANYVNLFSGQKRSKNILIEHGSKISDDLNKKSTGGWFRRKVLIPIVYRNADTVVTVSEGLKKELIGHFHVPARKIMVIQNSFDIKEIEKASVVPVTQKYRQIFSRKVIITSGRLAGQKNQLSLLSVFKKIREEFSCCLILLGDGNLKDELLIRVHQLGLVASTDENISTDADVYFLGYQRNPFQFLSRANLFVFPSNFEGFPLALCEAMICGVPVMSTDCRTGPREILAPGTEDQYESLSCTEHAEYGVLMPLLNNETAIDCWAKEIVQLLSNKELLNKYTRAGKERMQDFDKEKVMKRWIDLIS